MFKVPLAPLLITEVPPYDLVQYERVSYRRKPRKSASECRTREETVETKRANARTKMEVLARSCRHKKDDNSSSFQPI